MEGQAAQEAFVRYRRTGEPAALAKVFDAAAPELLLVAAHLVREPADAEDVVQQTFVSAIAHARDFDPSRPLMPWLVAILARCALRQRAKSSRRVEPRDVELPRMEDPHDAAAAQEFAETIARRVAALPAHYRVALNLRLLHGLSPTEIAHATEVPLETVRTRLKRGLELLRQGLPAGFAALLGTFALSERGLAAVRAAVLTHASTATAAGSVFAVVGGSMLMKTAIGFAAALVAAALMWFAWPRSISPVEPRVSAQTPSTVAPAAPQLVETQPLAPAAGRGEALVALDSGAGEAASTSPAPVCGIRGRVLRPDRAPAAECSVRAISFDPAELFSGGMLTDGANDASPLEHTKVANADGRFEITGLDPRATLVLLAAPLDAPAMLFRPERALRSGEIVDVGDLVLSHGATLVGRLFADGRPVEGARVRVAPDLPVSERFGYRLSCLRPDLLGPENAVLWDARAQEGGLTVIEPPAWVVPLWKSLGAPETVSDAEGRFRLSGVRAGTVTLTASKLGRFPKLVRPEVKANEELDLGDLELFDAETVRGRVLGADGEPLANAELLLGPRSLPGVEVHLLQRVGRTDADGRFAIGGQAPREVFVAVRAEGERAWCASGPHAIGSELEIRLPRRFELSVELIRGALDGADVRVSVRFGRPRGELLALGIVDALRTVDVRAGESRAKVTGLFGGVYDVCASAGGTLAVHTTVDLDRDRTVVLQLAPARALDVHVQDGAGKPLAGARVFAGAADSPAWMQSVLPEDSGIEHWSHLPLASARTDAKGVAHLAGLPPSVVTVVASHPGSSARAIDVAASERDVTLRLEPLGGIDVRIVREGRPIDGVRLLELSALGAELRAGLPVAPQRAVTDEHGLCTLRGLGAGRWRVTAYLPASDADLREQQAFSSGLTGSIGPRRNVRAVAEIEVLSTENASVVMEESAARLDPGKPTLSVHGRVKVNGLSRGGFVVCVYDFTRQVASGRIPMLKATADADGYYRIDGLGLPTQMQVTIQLQQPDDGGMLAYQEIAVPPGAAELQHNFDVEAGDVSGVVRDRGGRAVAKCNVYVSGDDSFGISLARETDVQGRFALECVPVGKIRIQALTPEGNTTLEGLEVKRGANQFDVTLLEYCKVAGRVNLAAIDAPAPLPIQLVLEMVDGPINYRPMGKVDRASGRFEIVKVMAGDYYVRVWCHDKWWKHPAIVHVLPGEAENLSIDPQPDTGPTELGPSPENLTPGYPADSSGF